MSVYPIKVQDTALLVVDIINSCCHPDCERKEWGIHFKKIRRMVPKLKGFIDEYRRSGGKVIYVDCVPWRKEFLAPNIVELYKNPKCTYYSKDRSGFSEGFYEVKPHKEDLVITKNTYDAFTNPKLNNYLKKEKINHVIIAGIFGDGCVMASIQGGFSAGHNLIILEDLIETTDDTRRQRFQDMLKKYTWPTMYGPTIDSKEFLRRIR